MVVAMQEKPMSARVKCMVTPVHRHFTDIYLHVDKYTHIPKKGNTDNKKTLCYYVTILKNITSIPLFSPAGKLLLLLILSLMLYPYIHCCCWVFHITQVTTKYPGIFYVCGFSYFNIQSYQKNGLQIQYES